MNYNVVQTVIHKIRKGVNLLKKRKFQELSELKGEMRKAGLTIRDLASAVGYSTSNMSKILSGEQDIRLSVMKAIVLFLNKKSGKCYSLSQLFEV